MNLILIFFFFGGGGCFVGVGGYSYLLEPLWWIGMITSKFFPFFGAPSIGNNLSVSQGREG